MSISGENFSDIDGFIKRLNTLTPQMAQMVINQSALDDTIKQSIITGSKFADTLVVGQEAAALSTVSLSSAYKGLAASVGMSTAAFTGMLAAVAAIGVGIYIFAKLHKSTAELKEEAYSAAKKYRQLNNDVTSVNEAIDDLNGRIEALESKDSLTFVEQEELNRLKEANSELKTQLEIAEALEKPAKAESHEAAVAYLNKDVSGRIRYSGLDMSQVNVGNAHMGTPITDIYTGTSVDVTRDMLADYESYLKRQSELEQLIKEYESNTAKDYKKSDAYQNLLYDAALIEEQIKLLTADIPLALREIQDFKKFLDTEQDSELLKSISTVEEMFSASFGSEEPADATQKFNDIWNSESFAAYKEELVQLSREGKIDPEVLSSNENYRQLLKATGKTAEETAQHINAITDAMEDEMPPMPVSHSISDSISLLDSMSGKWKTVNQLYEEFGNQDFKGFDTASLSSLADAFKELDGVNVEEFLKVLTDTNSTSEEIQNAFNQLAAEFIYASGCLEDLTDATAGQVIKELELNGITNASVIVQEHLAASREYSALTGEDLSDSTVESVVAFLNEANASETAKQYLARLELAKIAVNKAKIETSSDIDQIINLANAAMASEEAISKLKNAKSIIEKAENGTLDLTFPGNRIMLENAQETIEKIKNHTFSYDFLDAAQFKTGSPSSVKHSGGGSSSIEKEPTVFDFMENRINHLDAEIDKLKDNIDILVGYKPKNITAGTAIDLLIQKMDTLRQMYDKYMEEANKTGLSQEYIHKVQNGTMEIEYIQDENLVKLIQQYENWYKKAEAAEDAINKTKKELHDLNLSKLDNIIDQFQKMTDVQSQAIDTEKQLLELRAVAGEELYASDYISLAQKQLSLTQENAKAYNTLVSEMAGMDLPKDSDEWKKYNDQLQKYKNNMISAADAAEQYKKAMTDIVYKDLKDFKHAMDSVNNTISTMSGLIGTTELTDEFGKLTDRGFAQAALYAHQLANAKQESAEYTEAIHSLDDALESGLISQSEYNSRLYEYTAAQERAVTASKEAKDAILSLVKEGIQAEIDAKRKLIDETKAALEAEQNLHEYQNSISEKQNNISNLQRQIAVLANSTDRASIAQRLQLQNQLIEAQEDLYETQYNHELEQRQNALDAEYSSYEASKQKELEELDANLDAQNAAIEQYLNQVKNNYAAVYGILSQYGDEYSLKAVEDLTKPWESGGNAAELCSGAVGSAIANINYEISTLDFSPLWEMVEALNAIGEYGMAAGSMAADFEDISGTGSWQKGQGGKWWYGNSNEDYAFGGIYTIDGKQYSFDDAGYMQTEWQKHKGNYYYFDSTNGHMVKSTWIPGNDGKRYYLDKNGVMVTNAAVESPSGDGYYYMDSSGAWDGTVLSYEEVIRRGLTVAYKNGTPKARQGASLIDEKGPGTEAVITNSGTLLQFEGGETVFNGSQVKKLWEFADNPEKYMGSLGGLNIEAPDLSGIHPLQGTVAFNAPLFQIEGGLSSDMIGYVDEKCNWLKKNVGSMAYNDLKKTLLGK